MWLLDTTTLKLRHFITNIPDYVILSHTWGEGEVSFEDIAQPYAKDMVGYSKILRCCTLAVEAGFEWAWVDTCCIDKRSSAELSEAINSMYRWYWDAAICYVFLSDRSGTRDFRFSRWFKRGWTLQELLAPDVIEFYDSDWIFLGTKTSLIDRIVAATKIDKICLLHRTAIVNASIAAKFSWASARATTREEDMAYCLLGLVQVNMPMLYGEGPGAFYRLQLEILKQTNDQTIFAWEDQSHEELRSTSLFASSPAHFKGAASFRPNATRERLPATYEMTNNGLKITSPCISRRTGVVALLDCSNSTGLPCGLELRSIGTSTYERLNMPLTIMGHREAKQATPKTIYIHTGLRKLTRTTVKGASMRVYNRAEPSSIRCVATGTYWEVFPYQQNVVFEILDSDTQRNNLISRLGDQIVNEGEFISFVFTLDGLSDHLFFLGVSGGRLWIDASPCIPVRWIEEVNEKRKVFEAETSDQPFSAQRSHFTDCVRIPVGSGFTLEALARKIRSKEGLEWTVNISIKENEKPDQGRPLNAIPR